MKLTDPEDKGEEVYLLRGIILPYIKHVRSCSHPRTLFFIPMEEGASFINESTITEVGTIRHRNSN